jgi:hypothetical protein
VTAKKRFPPEVRERAIRLVFDQEHRLKWSAIEAITPKIGQHERVADLNAILFFRATICIDIYTESQI